jgi:hypothetical protein
VKLAEPITGKFVAEIVKNARESQIYVSIGVHEKIEGLNKFYNSHICTK